jgi:4-amino-4-deoxy-L-arabinose transferase-like glycosyltransferase
MPKPLNIGGLSVNKVLLGLLLLAVVFLETYNISKSPVEEWDEARRGINAISMINHNDYLNYYFLDEPDGFVNKPPLATWLITLNFRIFGYNAFALRLHSILATILFFIFSIKIIRLYKDLRFTLIVLSVLITVKGVIGFHVGRTGDTDSLLLLFMTAAIYYFLRYWDFGDIKSIYFCMLFAGLAFYSKGLGMMLMAPGIIAIIGFSWKKDKIFNRNVLYSVLLFLAFLLSWYILASSTSISRNTGESGTGNLWEGLWQVDGLTRFFSRDFEGGYNPWYLLHVFDSYFNVWNYVLYAGILFFIIQWFRRKKTGNTKADRLLNISALITLGLAIILMLSYNKHRWYFAPGYLFLSVITASFIEFLILKKEWVKYLLIILVMVLFARRIIELGENDTSTRDFFNRNGDLIRTSDALYVTREVRQHYVLQLIFQNPSKARILKTDNQPPEMYNSVLLTSKDIPGEITGTIDGYKLIRID